MLIKFAEHAENRTAIAEAGAIEGLVVQLERGSHEAGATSLKAKTLAAAVRLMAYDCL